jgi:5S rRNA maturation endonuclease (ribonuclease M5)
MNDPGAAFDRVLAALDQAGRRYKHDKPNHVQASCPGPIHKNGDRNPSLSVTAIEGQVLMHCQSGDPIEVVLDALGLATQDLFDDRRGAQYHYDDGRRVYRSPDKRFTQKGNTNGQRSTLYRLKAVQQAVQHNRLVFLVEGEKDVHSLESIGEVATTAPMGAANIDKCDLTPLHGGQVIAIVDRDESGEGWARYIRTQLASKAQIDFAQARIGKDVSDHVAAGLGVDQLDPFSFPLSPLLQAGRTAAWLGQQVFDPLEWIVPGLIPEGYSLLVGAPKIGKSWLALAIALAVSSGGFMFGKIYCGRPRPVLLLALEDSDRRMQDRLRKLQPEDPVWPEGLTYFTKVEQGRVVELIGEWLVELPPRARPLVLLDTIGKVIPIAYQGESTYQRDYRFSSQLQAITQHRPGMALIGLHHDRKASTDDFVESISGTNGIAGAADTILVINRPRNEPEGVLSITGRDVEEETYGLRLVNGSWDLMGSDLRQAAKASRTVKATAGLGERSAEIVEFVAEHPEGVRADDVAAELDISPDDAGKYLRRLHGAARIRKLKRGLYGPNEAQIIDLSAYRGTSETSEVSENKPPTKDKTDGVLRAREDEEPPIDYEEPPEED